MRVQGAFLCKSRGDSALVTPKRTFAAYEIRHPDQKIFLRLYFCECLTDLALSRRYAAGRCADAHTDAAAPEAAVGTIASTTTSDELRKVSGNLGMVGVTNRCKISFLTPY